MKNENVLPQVECMVCGTKVNGYYGRHGDTGTCSGKCEKFAIELRKELLKHPDERRDIMEMKSQFLRKRGDK